jgi:hypothetical protein
VNEVSLQDEQKLLRNLRVTAVGSVILSESEDLFEATYQGMMELRHANQAHQ